MIRRTTPRRVTLLRRLSRQIERLRQDLRRTSAETLLLAAMEEARPLTSAERNRATVLRIDMARIEQDLARLRADYARLIEAAVHQDVHQFGGARGPRPALVDGVRSP